MNKFLNLDANESVFFTRELESIKAKTYDIRYPQFKATAMIPVSSEAGPGAESITYRQYDTVGMMKLIADYADDLPRSDVKGVEFTSTVKSYGGSYGYTIQEVRASAMANKNLPTRKASAARQAWEQIKNTIGWLADGSITYGGLKGLLFNGNVTAAPSATLNWLTATPDEIINSVSVAVAAVRALTKGVEEPNMLIMPVEQYSRLATIPRSANSDTTVLKFLQGVHPGITFDWVNELDQVVDTAGNRPSGTAGAVDCAVLYTKNPDKLTYEIPQEFEQFPVQERNLEFVVPTHGRNGGVIVYYPLSVYIIEGV